MFTSSSDSSTSAAWCASRAASRPLLRDLAIADTAAPRDGSDRRRRFASASPPRPASHLPRLRARHSARHAHAHRAARTALLAAVRAVSHRRRARAVFESDQRARDGAVFQSLARHAADALDLSRPESLRAVVAARRVRARDERHRDSSRGRGRAGAVASEFGCGLLGRRDADARRIAEGARSGRFDRPRHRLGFSAPARWRAARRSDERSGHGRVLVSASRRLRRRRRLGARSVPGSGRVLHGLRRLRREHLAAAGLAGRGDGRADESKRRSLAADAIAVGRRAAQWIGGARGAGSGSRRRCNEGDDDRLRRRADLAFSGAQRARLRLGRVGEVSVGRDARRGRRSRRRPPRRYDDDQHLLPPRGPRLGLGPIPGPR